MSEKVYNSKGQGGVIRYGVWLGNKVIAKFETRSEAVYFIAASINGPKLSIGVVWEET